MPGDDNDPEEETGAVGGGRVLMADGAERLIAGVRAGSGPWVEAAVARIVDAWGAIDGPARSEVAAAASAAGARAAARVESELRALFTLDPAEQRATPLEV